MKNKMKGVMGVGLALVLAFTLVSAALPSADAEAAGEPLQWNRTLTPTIEPNKVLQPGTDLYDVAVGEDGETVYVVGALGPAPCGLGVSGKFSVSWDGATDWIWVDCDGYLCAEISGTISDAVGAFVGGFYGQANIDLYPCDRDGWAYIWGEVVEGGPNPGDDTLRLCGDFCLPPDG